MIKDTTIDFGLAIAYLVPGFVGFRGIAYLSEDARSLWATGTGGDTDLGRFAVVLLISVVIGMLLSMLRAASIDKTFGWNLRFMNSLPAYFASQPREDPDFTKLIAEGRLSAFQAAEISDKRPYKFAGNLLLAVVLFSWGYVAGMRGATLAGEPGTRRPVVAAIVVTVVVFGLYTAARRSHWRYAKNVKAFNALP